MDDDVATSEERKPAAAYVRVSSERQAADGLSLGEQERRFRDEIERLGYRCIEVYTDAGLSGRRADRPELQRMLADAGRGLVRLLVIPSLDRLGRSARDLHNTVAKLVDADASIKSLRGDVDTLTASGRLMVGALASIAEFESNMIGERTTAGKAAAARLGRRNGGARPYGLIRHGRTKTGRPSRAPARHLFSAGMLRCTCGASMVATTGTRWVGYRCRGRQSGTSPDCQQPNLRRDVVDEAVFRYFQHRLFDLEATRSHVAEQPDKTTGEAQRYLQAAELEAQLADERIARVRRAFQDGKLDPDDYAEQRQELLAEQAAALAEVEQRHARLASIVANVAVHVAGQTIVGAVRPEIVTDHGFVRVPMPVANEAPA